MYSIVSCRVSMLHVVDNAHENLFYQFSEDYALSKLFLVRNMLLSEYCYLMGDSIDQMVVNITQKHQYQVKHLHHM